MWDERIGELIPWQAPLGDLIFPVFYTIKGIEFYLEKGRFTILPEYF
jgi:hypothetical protein